ncbi:membrane protein [Streptomyces sp. H021]|nr:membrane protein [Streptomyces sp. IGB124]KOV35236.1 membrane protein [Streptomyces sp. H021]
MEESRKARPRRAAPFVVSGENQQVDASSTPDAVPGPPTGHAVPVVPAERASRARRLAAPALYLAAAGAAFTYVGTVDPNEPGHYPVCPLLRLTGILCPGCGGLRSAHAFAHGDLAAAFGSNALAVVGYFVFAGFMALWLVRAFRGGPVPRIVLRPAHWWAVGVVALVFAVVRNLSFGSALAP